MRNLQAAPPVFLIGLVSSCGVIASLKAVKLQNYPLLQFDSNARLDFRNSNRILSVFTLSSQGPQMRAQPIPRYNTRQTQPIPHVKYQYTATHSVSHQCMFHVPGEARLTTDSTRVVTVLYQCSPRTRAVRVVLWRAPRAEKSRAAATALDGRSQVLAVGRGIGDADATTQAEACLAQANSMHTQDDNTVLYSEDTSNRDLYGTTEWNVLCFYDPKQARKGNIGNTTGGVAEGANAHAPSCSQERS